MKKTLIMIFTVFVLGITVFAVCASETFTENESLKAPQRETAATDESNSANPPSQIASENVNSLISKEDAKKTAALYAAADYEDVRFFECEYDRDHSKKVYDIEFCYTGTKYECEVDAESAEVIKCEKAPCDNCNTNSCSSEMECSSEYCGFDGESHSCRYNGTGYSHYHHNADNSSTEQNSTTRNSEETATYQENESVTTAQDSSSEKNEDTAVSLSEIKLAVLSYAGVSADDVVFIESDYDYENGNAVCEISFCCNGYEYECKVNTADLQVTECEKEYCDSHMHSHSYHNRHSHSFKHCR